MVKVSWYLCLGCGFCLKSGMVFSEAVKLQADKGSNKLTLVSGGNSYVGILSRQWNTNAGAFAVSFSALSAGGVSLWAVRTGA